MVKKAVAVVSGGPDSISYAAVWRDRDFEIHPIVFDYGQKGTKEIRTLKKLSGRIGFKEPMVLDISSMARLWKENQLTDSKVRVQDRYSPSVVVPLRNGVFLMIASAFSLTIGATHVLYGAHLSDASMPQGGTEALYPDCTPQFASSLEEAIRIGHFSDAPRIELWSPAKEGLTKSELFKLGWATLGSALYQTWSCYLSGRLQCGRCESCRNRKEAFKAAGIPDETEYADMS